MMTDWPFPLSLETKPFSVATCFQVSVWHMPNRAAHHGPYPCFRWEHIRYSYLIWSETATHCWFGVHKKKAAYLKITLELVFSCVLSGKWRRVAPWVRDFRANSRRVVPLSSTSHTSVLSALNSIFLQKKKRSAWDRRTIWCVMPWMLFYVLFMATSQYEVARQLRNDQDPSRIQSQTHRSNISIIVKSA